MPVNLVVNGVGYNYPVSGDQNWAETASGWAVAVTQNLNTINTAIAGLPSGVFTLSNGANNAPSLRFLNSPTTGLYRKSTDTLGFVSAGDDVGGFDSTGSWSFGSDSSSSHFFTGNVTFNNAVTIIGAITAATGTFSGNISSAGIYRSVKGAAPTSLTRDNSYVIVGGSEQNTNSYRAIGFGFNNGIGGSGTNLPAFIAYKETTTTNFGNGRLQFFTRNVNTDTAPTLSLDIAENSSVSIPNGGLSISGSLSLSSITTPVSPTNGLIYYSSSNKFQAYQNGNFIDLDRDVVNVKDFGATGNGSTDDTTAIQNAINSLSSGGTLMFPPGTFKTTDNLTISTQKVSLVGSGDASKITVAAGKSITVTASYVKISNLWIQGPGSSTFASNNDACINAFGSSAASYISDLQITDCQLSDTQGYGIIAQFVNKVLINKNRIHDIAYAGIAILSSNNGSIVSNDIRDINITAGAVNSYGAFISRNTGTNVTYPLSQYWAVSNNIVANVPNWEGLDTHAGQNISFSNNIVTNCQRAIVAGPDNSTNAPNHITIANNVLDSTKTDGTSVYGIVLAGNSAPTYAEGCAITGNSIIRYGDTTSATGGALYINATSGLTVTGNTFIESSPIDIFLTTPINIGINIQGNTSIDVWSSNVNRATSIQVSGDGHTGSISGHIMTTRSKSATYVLTEGLRFDPSVTSVKMVLANNLFTSSGTYIVNEPSNVTPTSSVTTFTDQPGATGVWGNLTSISLNSGNWELDGAIEQYLNTATSLTSNSLAISINSGNTTSDQIQGSNQLSFGRPDSSSGQCGGIISGYKLSVSGPTTVYLKASSTFASGKPQYKCRLSARPVP